MVMYNIISFLLEEGGCCDIVNVNKQVVAMSKSYVALLTSANHSPLLEATLSLYKHTHIVN